MKKNYSFRRVSDPTSYTKELAAAFRLFYAKEPWNDFFTCPTCAQEGDPAKWPRFKEKGKCPACESTLEDFWSDQRTSALLTDRTRRPGFIFVGVFDEDGNLIGWCWGYEEASGVFYCDFMGVLPEHRDRTDTTRLMFASEELPDVRTPRPYTGSVFWTMCTTLSSFAFQQGDTRLTCRTHANATHIRQLFHQVGFRESGHDGERVILSRPL